MVFVPACRAGGYIHISLSWISKSRSATSAILINPLRSCFSFKGSENCNTAYWLGFWTTLVVINLKSPSDGISTFSSSDRSTPITSPFIAIDTLDGFSLRATSSIVKLCCLPSPLWVQLTLSAFPSWLADSIFSTFESSAKSAVLITPSIFCLFRSVFTYGFTFSIEISKFWGITWNVNENTSRSGDTFVSFARLNSTP